MSSSKPFPAQLGFISNFKPISIAITFKEKSDASKNALIAAQKRISELEAQAGKKMA